MDRSAALPCPPLLPALSRVQAKLPNHHEDTEDKSNVPVSDWLMKGGRVLGFETESQNIPL